MRILVTDGMDKQAMAKLRELGHEVVEQFYEPDQLGAALREFDAVVVRSKTKIRANHIDEAKGGKLKLIIRAGVGMDNIDIPYAEAAGIACKNTPRASSNAVAAFAPVGSGLPSAKIDEVVGVVKAYSSCVGEGPFVCEWFGEGAQQLRDAGAEYGAKTGRPRRVGPIDLVATRYGVETQGATNIALTKLDVLSYMDKIPVCAHYELNGEQTDDFPFPVLLQDAKPVVEYLPGWQCDISGARKWEDLPEAARSYVEYVEKAIGCHIGFVSVGAERESLIIR